MVMRSTRLEFLIVTIAFVVLLLCSRPPRSGNAETTAPIEPVAQSLLPEAKPLTQAVQPAGEASTRQTPTKPLDMTPPDRSSPARIPTKRMAAVDARNCPGLNYPDILYGEVTVRWVWDGNKLVPRRVCVVTEPDGVTTAWSFDNPGGAILTEIGETPTDGR